VLLPDDTLLIGDSERLAPRHAEARWWRQAPQCMLDNGGLHAGLRDEGNTFWGATLSGETVIRRSAIGLSGDGQVLYVGIGDHTTARAIAVAMKHAGAAAAAQLDVNWSYPKFVLFRPRGDGTAADAELVATRLCDGFELDEDDYLRARSPRDFFYLTRKPEAESAVAGCGR
jgi:hypothetical protein